MKFRDRRRIEAEIRETRISTSKMERALEEHYERLRKLQDELGLTALSQEELHADRQPVDPQGP
jgi:hypothetical protein